MPKLSHYTVVDGRLYCLNETTGTLVEVVLKDVPIGPLYGEVAIAMLSRGASPQTQGGNND
jgi:hypothetical protein